MKGTRVRFLKKKSPRNLFMFKMNLNEFQTNGDDSNTGNIFHELENDSRRNGFSMDSLSRGRDLFLEVDDVKYEILL